MRKSKKILIVDDSALMRRMLSDIIKSDERFEVKDIARDGLEAFELISKNYLAYDVILLDVNMPKLNGIQLLDKLKVSRNKLKIIMVSTVTKEGAKETLDALEKGAFDFVTKPENFIQAKSNVFRDALLSTVCAAVGLEFENIADNEQSIKQPATSNFERKPLDSKKMPESAPTSRLRNRVSTTMVFGPHKKYTGSKVGIRKLVAIACSTGGPKSLKEVIPLIPKNIDAPILLVQHMPKGFTASLAARLDELSEVRVKEAENKELLKKGWVYVAPGGTQMRVKAGPEGTRILITDEPPREGLKPCANMMYESLVGSRYDEITCVVLTGMGADGTLGIAELGAENNIYVIGQDEATSIVYGMPKAIATAKLVDEVQPLTAIAQSITKNVGVLKDGC